MRTGLWREIFTERCPARTSSQRCRSTVATRKLSTYRRKRDFTKTAEPSGTLPVQAFEAAALRDPEARGAPAALRPAPGARRRLQVLGRHARPVADSAGQAPRRRSGGSSARLRRLRRHDPEGPVRRRHRAAVGPRLLGAARRPVGRRAVAQGRAEVRARGRAVAGQLGARAHEERSRRRQAHELAADQASRRIRARRRGHAENARRRSLGRLRPHDERDRGGQGPRARSRSCSKRASWRAPMRYGTRRNRAAAKRSRRSEEGVASKAKRARKSAAKVPDFIEPELCKLVEQPAERRRAGRTR